MYNKLTGICLPISELNECLLSIDGPRPNFGLNKRAGTVDVELARKNSKPWNEQWGKMMKLGYLREHVHPFFAIRVHPCHRKGCRALLVRPRYDTSRSGVVKHACCCSGAGTWMWGGVSPSPSISELSKVSSLHSQKSWPNPCSLKSWSFSNHFNYSDM